MPELISVLSYEVGIRLTQALALLSDDQNSYAFEIEAALGRLELSASRFCDHFGDSSSRLKTIAKGSADIWSAHLAGGCDFEHVAGLPQRLVAARDHQIELLGPPHSDVLNWFRLGLEIVDGVDLTWSDGRLQSVPSEYSPNMPLLEGLIYDRLITVNPEPPNWKWRDPDLLDQLLRLVKSSRSQLFHEEHVLSGADCGIFQGLDFKRLWGWHAAELGLATLARNRVAPHWDQPTKSLHLGNERVHVYRKKSGNQIDLLKAFQDAGWPGQIPCPEEMAHHIDQTIKDLNRGPVGAAIRFRGGAKTVIWELAQIMES